MTILHRCDGCGTPTDPDKKQYEISFSPIDPDGDRYELSMSEIGKGEEISEDGSTVVCEGCRPSSLESLLTGVVQQAGGSVTPPGRDDDDFIMNFPSLDFLEDDQLDVFGVDLGRGER